MIIPPPKSVGRLGVAETPPIYPVLIVNRSRLIKIPEPEVHGLRTWVRSIIAALKTIGKIFEHSFFLRSLQLRITEPHKSPVQTIRGFSQGLGVVSGFVAIGHQVFLIEGITVKAIILIKRVGIISPVLARIIGIPDIGPFNPVGRPHWQISEH